MSDYEFSDVLHSGIDYTLPVDERTIWIEVGGISLWIRADVDTINVEAYPLHDEMAEPVASLAYRFDDVTYSELALEQLWDDLEEIGIDDNGIIDMPFLHFPAGTNREVIWHWFDDRHPRGVAYLLNVRGFNDAQ